MRRGKKLRSRVTFFKAIALSGLGIFGILLSGCNPAADLIPEAPAADEIEPFDRDNIQLFFTLNIDQATSLLKNNPDTLVVDVRKPDEFAEGHLPNALNYDVKFEGFRQEIETLDAGEKILIYGSGVDTKSIRTADSALTKMKAIGFRNVYRMTGGIEAWIEAGQPFIRDLPE